MGHAASLQFWSIFVHLNGWDKLLAQWRVFCIIVCWFRRHLDRSPMKGGTEWKNPAAIVGQVYSLARCPDRALCMESLGLLQVNDIGTQNDETLRSI